MKIRALRLAHVGMFSSPTALEGLSGRLDVLVGPNEMGKSTLFSALIHLLATPATSKSREVAALLSDGGSAPVVEADIEIGNRLLRLRKRYLSRPSARLDDLRSGERWLDGDAEKMAEQMLGADARGAARGLLWVSQGASFSLPDKPEASLASALASLIEREAADAAGAAETRRISEQVRQRLDVLVTGKTGKARANGPLDAARKRRDTTRIQLEQARSRAAAAQARIEQLRTLSVERSRIADPEVTKELSARSDAAIAAVTAAERARQMEQTAVERLRSAKLVRAQAAEALQRHDEAAGRSAQLQRELADARAHLSALQHRRGASEPEVEDLRAALAAHEKEIEAARMDLKKARDNATYTAAEAELARIEESLQSALDAAAAGRAAAESLAAIRVTQASLDRSKDLAVRLAAAEARVAADAVTATFQSQPGSRACPTIGGQEVLDGKPILIDRPTEIVIEGVGTFLIEPPRSEGGSAVEQRDSLDLELRRSFDEQAVTNLTDGEAELERRRQLEACRTTAGARLAAVAPRGVADLEEKRRQAASRLSSISRGEAGLDAAAIEARVETVCEVLGSKRARLTAMEAELGAAAHEITRITAVIGSVEQQIADLAAATPNPASADDLRATLQKAVAIAEADIGDAVREHSAWREAAPSAEAFDKLHMQVARSSEALSALRARREAIDRDLAALEGALRRDGEEGSGADVPGLEEELSQAEARVSDLEIDSAALDLIASRLDRARSDHRDQVLRPIVSRLEPLLSRLFPDARVTMEGPLLAARLDRGSRSDTHARLSGGTREQIATLVRLAYADLMASRGLELPLVLDDALVFSDDQRLEIMLDLLAAAARNHQVILLSCHERSLGPMLAARGVRPLDLTPWDTEAPAMTITASPQKGRTSGSASALHS